MFEWPHDTPSATGRINGPDGSLEISVDRPRERPRSMVVICHPHPQHGGTKDNKVVYMTARAVVQAGLAAVRFNFRGVGHSEGRYDAGVGEIDDARCVRDWAREVSGLPCAGLAGFSFGSAVALRLAAADTTPALLTIGFPSAYFVDEPIPRPDCRWRAIFGDEDDVIDVQASIEAVRELRPAVDVQILHGAGHFLHGRLSDLRKLVLEHWQQGGDDA